MKGACHHTWAGHGALLLHRGRLLREAVGGHHLLRHLLGQRRLPFEGPVDHGVDGWGPLPHAARAPRAAQARPLTVPQARLLLGDGGN